MTGSNNYLLNLCSSAFMFPNNVNSAEVTQNNLSKVKKTKNANKYKPIRLAFRSEYKFAFPQYRPKPYTK